MLLPGLFAICLAFYVPIRSVSSLVIGTSTAAWAVCAIGLLHYPQTIAFTHGIANERAFYVAVSGTPHPVTSTNYLHSPLGRIGTALKNVAVDRAGAKDAEVLLSDSGSPDPSLYAPIQMPESVVAPLINIGVEADIAGPHVYIFDELSLANPIGSHLKEDVRTRPGHSQVILGDWMVARFVPQGNGPVADQLVIQDARAALNCGVIRRYLQAITSPLSFGRAVSNFVHAFQYSAFTMSPDPSTARRQMCDG
jgi:arabinofuranosyltransferase